MGWFRRNPKEKVMKQLLEIERGVKLMRSGLYQEKPDMKEFQKGLLKYYTAHGRLNGMVDLPHIISDAKKIWRDKEIADSILKEINEFVDFRKRIRTIFEGGISVDAMKNLLERIERSWCPQSTLHRVKGKNLLAVYRECVLRYSP